MKRVALLRHAKADAQGDRPDVERVLAPEGRAEMARMARHLAAGEARFDLAIVSSSARTRETWDLARRTDVPVRLADALYDASVETAMAILRGLDETVGSVILVGHNPGMEELAARLRGGGAALPAAFPPAGLAVFTMPAETWVDLRDETGRLVAVLGPSDG